MAELDFITAFARLLRDGPLRDAWAADPLTVTRQIGLAPLEWPAWLQLVPAQVEAQADVLLRKRLDLVRRQMPATCRNLESQLWSHFRAYARACWPPAQASAGWDAREFCRRLHDQQPNLVNQVEWHRLDFRQSQRKVAIHIVGLTFSRKRARPGVQLLWRKSGRCREWWFYFGL